MNSLYHLLLLLLEFHRVMLAILSNDGLSNLDIAQQTPVVDDVLDGGVLAEMDADTLQVPLCVAVSKPAAAMPPRGMAWGDLSTFADGTPYHLLVISYKSRA